MELYNLMKLYVFQNQLLMLDYKPQFHHDNSLLPMCTVALDGKLTSKFTCEDYITLQTNGTCTTQYDRPKAMYSR